MPVVSASIHLLNLAAFAIAQKRLDTTIDKPIKRTSQKVELGKEVKCLMLSRVIAFGIKFSTRDKNASFPVVVHREVLPSKN